MSNNQNGARKDFASSRAPSQVSITLYQGGHAVVREVREVNLEAGGNTVLLEGLPTQYVPNSLKFRRVQGPGNFNPGCITIQPANLSLPNILAAYVGRKITVLQPTGVQRLRNTGKLVAMFGNLVAIEKDRGDGVLVVPTASEFEFPEGLPDGLSATQSVVMEPVVTEAGAYRLHSLYKTGGLNWSAHYTGFFDKKTGKFERLECTILLVNNSGVRYAGAKLKLFATANVSHAKSGRGVRMALASSAPRGGAEAFAESVIQSDGAAVETVGDQKMYTLDGDQTLENGQPKEAYLLLKSDVPTVVELYVPRHQGFYELEEGDETKTGCPIRLRLKNDEASNLGSALPRGPLSVFEDDSAGEAQETNSGAISRDVAVGEEFVIDLQNPSSDVKYSRRMVEWHQDPEPVEDEEAPEAESTPAPAMSMAMTAAVEPEAEAAEDSDEEKPEAPRFRYETRETVVHNFGTEPAEVLVYEQFPEGAEFSDESHTFAVKGTTQGTYKVTVPAGDKVAVRYSVKYRIN